MTAARRTAPLHMSALRVRPRREHKQTDAVVLRILRRAACRSRWLFWKVPHTRRCRAASQCSFPSALALLRADARDWLLQDQKPQDKWPEVLHE